MSKYNILDCPFCGEKAEIKTGYNSTQGRENIAWVECQGCRARTKEEVEWGNDYIGIVVSLWNRRTDTLSVK